MITHTEAGTDPNWEKALVDGGRGNDLGVDDA
jgi:hypothetical protein